MLTTRGAMFQVGGGEAFGVRGRGCAPRSACSASHRSLSFYPSTLPLLLTPALGQDSGRSDPASARPPRPFPVPVVTLSPPADMLAWLHASLASEQEFLVSLFGDDSQHQQQNGSGSGGGGAAAAAAAAAEMGVGGAADGGAPTIAQLLDAVFESVCRPVKVGKEWALPPALAHHSHSSHTQFTHTHDTPSQTHTHTHTHAHCSLTHTAPSHRPLSRCPEQVRIEQVLMSSPPPLLCFRLTQLLAFYLATVESLLGGGQPAGRCAWAALVRAAAVCSVLH